MSCQQGSSRFTLTPHSRPVAKRLQQRILLLQNPQLYGNGVQNVSEAVSNVSSDNTSMSGPRRPLDSDVFLDEEDAIISELLAGLSLAGADVAGEQQRYVDTVGSMQSDHASDVLSAGQQRGSQHGGASQHITDNMQLDITPNVSVDMSAFDDDGDLLLGGFPEALSVQRSSQASMESVVQQFVVDDHDEFLDVYDVDQVDDPADIADHPSAQALAQQLQIAQMQNQLAQEQNLRHQHELQLREKELQWQQQESERAQHELQLQMQLQLQAQQLENERLLRENERSQHELFVFRQMQEDEISHSVAVSMSPDVPLSSQSRVQAAHVVDSVENDSDVLVPVPSVQNFLDLSTPVAEAIGQSSGTSQQQLQQATPAVQQPSLRPQSVKLEKPSTFSGKHSEIQNWLFEMRQYVDSVGLGSYGNACRFIVTYLKGQAQTWWRMYSIDHKQAGTTSIFDTLDVDTLLSELETQFSDVDKDIKLRDRLLNLKQRNTVQEYTSQFKALQIELGAGRLDDNTAFHVYQQGLQPHIRLQVLLKDPTTLSELQLYADRYARAHQAFAQSGGNSGQQQFRSTFRGGSRGGGRSNYKNSNRAFVYKTHNQQWGSNNGRSFTGKYNPNAYQNLSQYSNTSFKGSSPMVVNNAQRGGKGPVGKRFEGECNHCGRYGHRKRDCFTFLREQQNGGNGNKNKQQVQFNNVQQHSVNNMQQQQQQSQQQIPGTMYPPPPNVGAWSNQAGSSGQNTQSKN